MLSRIFRKKPSTKSKLPADKISHSQTLAAPLNIQSSLPSSVSADLSANQTRQNFADSKNFSRTVSDVTNAEETDDELESTASEDENDFYTCAGQPRDQLFPDYASVTLIRRSAMNALKQADFNDPVSAQNTKSSGKQKLPESRLADSRSNAKISTSSERKLSGSESGKADNGKETFELSILRAVHSEACDVLVARHYFASLNVDILTYCDACDEQIWGLCRAALRCMYCNATVHPNCVACVQYQCPSSRIEDDFPKLDVADSRTLTLRRVAKNSNGSSVERVNSSSEAAGIVMRRQKVPRPLNILPTTTRNVLADDTVGHMAIAIAGVTVTESSDVPTLESKPKAPIKSVRSHDPDLDESEQFYTAQSDELRGLSGEVAPDGSCYILEDARDAALAGSFSPSASIASDSELCTYPSLLEFNPLIGPIQNSNTNISTDDETKRDSASVKSKKSLEPTSPSAASRAISAVPHYAFSTLDTHSIKRFSIRITELKGAAHAYNTMSTVSSSRYGADSGLDSSSQYSQTVKLAGSRPVASEKHLGDVKNAQTGSSSSSTMTSSAVTVLPNSAESADWLASVTRDRFSQLLNVYNTNLLGFSAQSVVPQADAVERLLQVAGFIRVYVNLIRPIKLNLSARPVTIYDLVEAAPNGQAKEAHSKSPSPEAASDSRHSLVETESAGDGDEVEALRMDFGSLTAGATQRRRTYRSARSGTGTATDKLSTFYLPRGTMKVLHISSRTTTYDVISCLLNKFHIRDNPRKFALYEHTVESAQDVTIRKFLDGECPLVTCLRWVNLDAENPIEDFLCTLQKKRLVIQENESGDVDWEAFSVPELNNFLAILQREEDQRLREIAKKYKNARRQLLKRLRHVEKRQATPAAVWS